MNIVSTPVKVTLVKLKQHGMKEEGQDLLKDHVSLRNSVVNVQEYLMYVKIVTKFVIYQSMKPTTDPSLLLLTTIYDY